jgi:hypothetical protein
VDPRKIADPLDGLEEVETQVRSEVGRTEKPQLRDLGGRQLVAHAEIERAAEARGVVKGDGEAADPEREEAAQPVPRAPPDFRHSEGDKKDEGRRKDGRAGSVRGSQGRAGQGEPGRRPIRPGQHRPEAAQGERRRAVAEGDRDLIHGRPREEKGGVRGKAEDEDGGGQAPARRQREFPAADGRDERNREEQAGRAQAGRGRPLGEPAPGHQVPGKEDEERRRRPEIEVEPAPVVAQVVQGLAGILTQAAVGLGIVRVGQGPERSRRVQVEVEVSGQKPPSKVIVRLSRRSAVAAVGHAGPAQEKIGREHGGEGQGSEPEPHVGLVYPPRPCRRNPGGQRVSALAMPGLSGSSRCAASNCETASPLRPSAL